MQACISPPRSSILPCVCQVTILWWLYPCPFLTPCTLTSRQGHTPTPAIPATTPPTNDHAPAGIPNPTWKWQRRDPSVHRGAVPCTHLSPRSCCWWTYPIGQPMNTGYVHIGRTITWHLKSLVFFFLYLDLPQGSSISPFLDNKKYL